MTDDEFDKMLKRSGEALEQEIGACTDTGPSLERLLDVVPDPIGLAMTHARLADVTDELRHADFLAIALAGAFPASERVRGTVAAVAKALDLASSEMTESMPELVLLVAIAVGRAFKTVTSLADDTDAVIARLLLNVLARALAKAGDLSVDLADAVPSPDQAEFTDPGAAYWMFGLHRLHP
ncbi:hypothetical protein [Nonomuraea soli]|uniref:Uncharacterized protein n=1 Tax=Nonomuraea soli TaxID=1032476 RepID=A0A7W0HNT2_9ACTN|nr:hypothetical protein [Nonomuraea soli]MBA2890062.1 hypothetical protein [Nonomuraea soli]